MTTDNDKAMDPSKVECDLRTAATDAWAKATKPTNGYEQALADAAVCEILRLRAELAKVTAERDAYRKAKQENDDRFMAERDAARTEVERLNLTQWCKVVRIEAERDAAIRDRNTAQEGEFNARRAMHDAEVDRNEFAASEVAKLATRIGAETGLDLSDFAADHVAELRRDGQWGDDQIRAAELRQAAGSAPAGERIRPFSEWSEFDGEALWFHLPVVESAFYVGRPDDSDWPYDGDPDGLDDSDQIGWVPVPRLASDGSELLRKAAGAAAPVDFLAEMLNAKPGPCESWGPMTDDAKAAADAMKEGGAKPYAELREELGLATPAADARQPDDDPHMFSSDGRHHPDKNRMVVGFIVPQPVADEVRSLEARLAASEKAKAELLERIGSAYTWVQWASADLRRATEAAAERAGGAS